MAVTCAIIGRYKAATDDVLDAETVRIKLTHVPNGVDDFDVFRCFANWQVRLIRVTAEYDVTVHPNTTNDSFQLMLRQVLELVYEDVSVVEGDASQE